MLSDLNCNRQERHFKLPHTHKEDSKTSQIWTRKPVLELLEHT
jgi:hypothetical protein